MFSGGWHWGDYRRSDIQTNKTEKQQSYGKGNKITPSCVSYHVGDTAKEQITRDHKNIVLDVKRLMGSSLSDARVLQMDLQSWPFKVIEGSAKRPVFVFTHEYGNRKLSHEEISSIISKNVKMAAEAYLGTTVTYEVISAPDYFSDKQLQPVTEPLSAAISNDYNRSLDLSCPKEKDVVIIEIGRGTLVVSLINFNKDGNISVRASSGNTHFGGKDFEMLMVKHCVQEFKKTEKEDVAHNAKPMMRLRVSSEVAKRYLLSTAPTLIKVDSFYEGIDFSIKFSSEKFEEINAPYFNKCIEHVKICLRNAKIHKQDVDDVVIVGGSTQIPMVRQLLMQFFDGKPTFKSFNEDEPDVFGATTLALYLSGNGNKLLQDVTPQSCIKIGRSRNFLRQLIKKMQQKVYQFCLQ